jgi:hypothetical protein
MPDSNIVPDPLPSAGNPERVNYATGVLLDKSDFQDEQTYHRARLARSLQYLVGMGTISGLGVTPPDAGDGELILRVEPGLALDRYGRLIELDVAECIRLARWFAAQDTSVLARAIHRAPAVSVDVAVVADVFLAWHECPRAKTPALASGPFDALDAVVPARLADCHQLTLVPRAESTDPPSGGGPAPTIPTPANFWPDPASIADPTARRTQLLQAVIGSWFADPTNIGPLPPLREHVAGQDTSAVFLARVTIPVTLAAGAPADTRPVLRLDQRVSVDNSPRPFIFLPGKWLGQAPTSRTLVLP